MKRVMIVIILLALLAAATWLISHPTQATTHPETVDNRQEFTATAVITITMTGVKD